ncbi:multiple sugar transport system permease protein [Motilibacter rhizosphaerae]|uniref:Multiple sugar transport system permease protein n=1 Tax=Motilibacter rhizosphaerae TaxID=598652 RepID=A0A4Q7NWP4_9ACTN|nr:carbohydrate ABC transporter permease [Motilibacter rhizosphaerae]RZS91338.1 multiple sugar transport system permease protein [Motilibacter rhizosphaerae]
MTTTETGMPPASVASAVAPAAAAVRRRRPSGDDAGRGIVSPADRRVPAVRQGLRLTHGLLLVVLVVVGLGPMLWLAKAALTPTQDTLTSPMAVFPHGATLSNIDQAWNDIHLSRYFWNTVVVAAGSWFAQLLVATTGGYALSVLRPAYARVLNALVLATLFVPAVVLLVPLYLTVLDTPFTHRDLVDTYWAVWLPAGANAFNVVLVKRFFDNLPREVFEAAEVDGAGPARLFWYVVLPMSRPILGVVSVFAVLAAWKDFLWPLLVLRNPDIQPLSVRLPTLAASTDLGVYLAALFLSTAFPIVLFLLFQRVFLRSSGLGGAVKG